MARGGCRILGVGLSRGVWLGMWEMVRGLKRSDGRLEDMDKLFSTLEYKRNSDQFQREDMGDRPTEDEMRNPEDVALAWYCRRGGPHILRSTYTKRSPDPISQLYPESPSPVPAYPLSCSQGRKLFSKNAVVALIPLTPFHNLASGTNGEPSLIMLFTFRGLFSP